MAKGVEKLRCPPHGSEESGMQTGKGQGQVIASKVTHSVDPPPPQLHFLLVHAL